MQFIGNRQADLSTTSRELMAPKHNALCREALERYGSAERFCSLYLPARAQEIAEHYEESMASPGLVTCLQTFGDKVIESLLQLHLAAALPVIGPMNETDLQITIRALCCSPAARIMHFSTIVVFFSQLRTGAFPLYESEVTPRRILEAFHKWAPDAKRREEVAEAKWQKRQEDEEARKHKSQCISFPEFLRRKVEEHYGSHESKTLGDILGFIITSIEMYGFLRGTAINLLR